MQASEKAWVVVVAAGRGVRFGRAYNKVFHPINGRTVISRCLDALEASGAFEGAVLVLSEQDVPLYQDVIGREGESTLVRAIAMGGNTRQESVRNGLELVPGDVSIVAIHDAARPFVAKGIIEGTINSALEHGSGIPGCPVTDTVKRLNEEGNAVETLPRDQLCTVQTPQVFKRALIVSAHDKARREGYEATDDAALYEKYIDLVRVVMMPECEDNIKVTTFRDVRIFEKAFRTGTGYDAHRLIADRKLVLCGVDVPFEKGLLGHSDADVATHALIDALLGAAALGDIGSHFPDSDERYRGISSLALLGETIALLEHEGFCPVNADVTIVAQRPKLKDHIGQMRENIARVMALPIENVNVKATTTEGMGFEGEGIGISAQAIALIAQQRGALL